MTFQTDLITAAEAVTVQQKLTPTAALSAQANVGAITLSVDDVRYFVPKGLVWFWDSPLSAEEPQSIASVSPSGQLLATSPIPGTITLDMSGMGYAGLLYQHNQGVTIATNLCEAVALSGEPMLANNWPVWCFGAFDQSDTAGKKGDALAMWTPRSTLSLYYRINAGVDQRSGINRNVFNRRVTRRAHGDVDALVTALQKNYRLSAAGIQAANYVTEFVRSLRLNDKSTPACWEGYVDIPAVGTLKPPR